MIFKTTVWSREMWSIRKSLAMHVILEKCTYLMSNLWCMIFSTCGTLFGNSAVIAAILKLVPSANLHLDILAAFSSRQCALFYKEEVHAI